LAPIRIIIIAILLYIGYRLIVSGFKSNTQSRKNTRKKSGGKEPVSDVLEEDPICKKLVPRQQAVQYQYHENTYYFCSKKCCKVFRNQQGDNK